MFSGWYTTIKGKRAGFYCLCCQYLICQFLLLPLHARTWSASPLHVHLVCICISSACASLLHLHLDHSVKKEFAFAPWKHWRPRLTISMPKKLVAKWWKEEVTRLTDFSPMESALINVMESVWSLLNCSLDGVNRDVGNLPFYHVKNLI